MRVLRFANGIYPEAVGGIEVNVARISEMQARKGHHVEVHVPARGVAGPALARPYDVRFHDEGAQLFGNPLTLHPYRYVRRHGASFDVVHAHSHLYSGSNQAAYACRRAGIPFILTNEGMYSQTAPLSAQKAFMRTVGLYTFRAARAVLTYSQAEADEMARLGVDRSRIRVISQGVDTAKFHPRPRPAEGPARLLWVGRHAPGKGVEILLRALALLARDGPDVTLTLVGQGAQRPRAETLAKELGLEGRARFLDFVTEEELARLYAESHLFVLASVSEAMNRAVLESLSSGTPALTTDLPHLRALLEGCGGVVPERTPEAFARAIAATLSGDLARMGQEGRRRVVERHSWARALEDVQAVFDEVARA